MWDYRFYATAVPLLVVLAAVGFDAALTHRGATAGAPSPFRLVHPARYGAALLAVWLLANVVATIDRSRDDFEGQVTVADVASSSRPLIDARDAWALHDPLVMTPDAGAVVDDLDLRILDMAGLLDPQISHLMDDVERRQEYAFADRRPELVRAGDPSWTWNVRWRFDDRLLRTLGYVRVPSAYDNIYLRRDLIVAPRRSAPDPSGARPGAAASASIT